MKKEKAKKEKFTTSEKLVLAVSEGNREKAKKLLEQALKEKVAKKIKDTVKDQK